MALEPFGKSEALTMGVELELQLISTHDFDLSSSANDLLELLRRKPFPGVVTPEMTQSMIEIATDIQREHGPLLAQLRQTRDTLVNAGDRLNIALAGGGTHPFQRWFEQRIFAKPRSTAIWPSSSPCSANTCTLVAAPPTRLCFCCTRSTATCRTSSRSRRRRRIHRAWTPCSIRPASTRCLLFP